MSQSMKGMTAIVTGATSGIGYATATALAAQGIAVALLGRRRDRLNSLALEIEKAGGVALPVPCDITDRAQADAAVSDVMRRFGRVDVLVNNAGLMLLGPVAGAEVEDWERMIAVNQKGLLYMTNAALPHLLETVKKSGRGVTDIVNISSIAGRVAWANYGVYNMTKFGVNGFTEALRQEITKKHVRVGVLEPGGVATELGSHNEGAMREQIDAFYQSTEVLQASDVADAVVYMITRPRHASVSELWLMPTDQA